MVHAQSTPAAGDRIVTRREGPVLAILAHHPVPTP
jgi:hypothetical protein